MWGIEIVVMLCMIALNGLLAAYEIALASITQARLHALSEQARRGAHAALYMKKNMEASLAVVQLGITFAGAIAAATAGAGAGEQIAPWLHESVGLSPAMSEAVSICLVVLPLTVITITFGELIPKVFALRTKEWVCLRLSPAMRWLSYIVWPLVWVLENTVTLLVHWGERRWHKNLNGGENETTALQELRSSAAIARTSRLIGMREEQIILGAAELSQRPVREAMLAAEFISMLSIDSTPGDALVAAHLDMHTRYPVTEQPGDPQAIVGYVNFKDLVAHMQFSPNDASLRPIMRSIVSFEEQAPVAQCLERLMRDRCHIALIRDSTDTVIGMVTMEDMLEELVGDIEDEYDRLPAHVVPTGHGWIVGGGLALEELRNRTGVDLTVNGSEPTTSIANWVAQHLDRSVRGGETVRTDHAKVTVRKSRRHKVLEAYVRPNSEK